MSLTLRNELGFTEAVITDEGNLNDFYQIASLLSEDLQINFHKKEDNFDEISWNFKFNSNQLTLQYSIYNGITVFPTRTGNAAAKENKSVVDFMNKLEGRLDTLFGTSLKIA